jgi:hypothetical protein
MPRVKLSDKYQKEREEICEKLISIVGNEFYLCDLDADVEKQQAILALKDEIPKYFAVSALTTFKSTVETKRDHLIIVRGILKKQGYNFEGTETFKKMDTGLFKKTMKYRIFRNNSIV